MHRAVSHIRGAHRALWKTRLETHLFNHDSIDAHLLESSGVVEHVGPAHGKGEHHGSHVLLAVGKVQYHRRQHEQRLHKAEGRGKVVQLRRKAQAARIGRVRT